MSIIFQRFLFRNQQYRRELGPRFADIRLFLLFYEREDTEEAWGEMAKRNMVTSLRFATMR